MALCKGDTSWLFLPGLGGGCLGGGWKGGEVSLQIRREIHESAWEYYHVIQNVEHDMGWHEPRPDHTWR